MGLGSYIDSAGIPRPITGVANVDPDTGLPVSGGSSAGLTDAQLRAAPVPVSVGVTFNTGTVDATTQRVALATNVPLPAGSNSIGTVILGAGTASIGKATLEPSSSNGGYLGSAGHYAISAASINATSAKNSSTNLGGLVVANTSASWRYLKLYNKSTAPAVATDVPFSIISVPPGATVTYAPTGGIRLNTGLGYVITGAAATTDATAVGAGDVIVSLTCT